MSTENQDQHGWAPDVGEGGSERARKANEKAFGEPSSETGAGRRISEEERAGVSPTDTEPESPHGVGESTRKGGEEYEGDNGRAGTKGESQRPYGTTDEADGVAPSAPTDDDSPYLQPGDQGG
jgi:hypothetical protein